MIKLRVKEEKGRNLQFKRRNIGEKIVSFFKRQNEQKTAQKIEMRKTDTQNNKQNTEKNKQ